MAVSNLGGERTNSGPKAVINVLIWIVAIIILGALAYSILQPKGAVVDDQTPESLMRSYSEFASTYRPPSRTTPSLANVEAYFKYFDQSSADFFDENYEKMAWIQHKANPGRYEWETMSDGEKQGEAVKYLLTVGPLRGASIQQKKEEGGVLKVTLLSTQKQFDVELTRSPTGWRFADLMGQTSTINQQLSRIQLPNSSE